MTRHHKLPKQIKHIKYNELEGVYLFPSRSNHDLVYEVIRPNPNKRHGGEDETGWFCSCKSFFYRKRCGHVEYMKKIDDIRRLAPNLMKQL